MVLLHIRHAHFATYNLKVNARFIYIVSNSILETKERTDGQRHALPTTSTTIAAVTSCRRRWDSSTVSGHKRTDELTDAENRIRCIIALKWDN